ncbi:TonB-dependent hemoglobin/transferrin/lactoferrin family receptor [Aestuariibacter halophilus]|uniref:TonB-dependent hemoglobin/transferrin/lactoferrin family receptor n=1 Tax=Fluctibacter halophilus TaxID=226011 RepID=A0ABS8G5Q3_9ALTE|nr:TonB-dependent hemoglobin/transferrin/lactoferrin family receptor [Aestuariibacter halophilus]MCC2615890.1 TonB-dependent hemoglobin/transferrin/lactoferrin family receptor [Aestuariibacter halophilus]
MKFTHRGGVALAVALVCSGAHADDFDGETLVVSGARIDQPLEDVVGSVSVIDDSTIEHQMANDLQSLFRYDPSITSTGAGLSPQTLTVRGIGGNRLVYIKDGRRSNDGYAGGGGYLVGRGYFDTDGIQQVEVAKGAASSLYGSDGIGGIVVVTTKDPADYLTNKDHHSAVSLGYDGQDNQRHANLTGAVRLDDWQLSAVLTHRESAAAQNYSQTLPDYDARSDSVLLKGTYSLDKHRSVKVTLDHYTQSNEQVLEAGANQTDDEDVSSALSLDYASTAPAMLWDGWQGQLYVSRYTQDSNQIRAASGGATDFNDYRFEQDIVGFRGVFNLDIEQQQMSHALVYGLDLDVYETRRPRWKTQRDAEGNLVFERQRQAAFPGADTTMAGVFLQDTINMGQWRWVLGGRLDHYALNAINDPLYDNAAMQDIRETAFSPKLAVRYTVNPQLSAYIQYVQGFKIPPHDQAYQSHGVEPFYRILPNPALNAEESETVEAGVQWYGDDVHWKVAAYYSKFDNFIETALVGTEPTYIPGVNTLIYQYQNIAQTRINGVELSSQWWLGQDLTVTMNLAYSDGENNDTDQPLTSISPLQGSVLLSQQWQQWQLTGALRFARAMNDVPDDSSGNALIKSHGWGVLDVFASYRTEDWQLTFGIDNLLDKEYVPYERIAGQAQGTALEQYTQPGRNVSARVRYTF